MPSRKNNQDIPNDLFFVKISIFRSAAVKILSVFNQLARYQKCLETSFFDKFFENVDI